jgi:cell division transport system ATP-binding protein
MARALMNRPRLLLADEPTGNLDKATTNDIIDIFERVNADGTTIVMATHNDVIVDRLQRRVIELSHGEVIRDEALGRYDPPIA